MNGFEIAGLVVFLVVGTGTFSFFAFAERCPNCSHKDYKHGEQGCTENGAVWRQGRDGWLHQEPVACYCPLTMTEVSKNAADAEERNRTKDGVTAKDYVR